ncbi:MAG: protein kinase, partial [Xanthomonadales bacterium]|nr:protein kinase [Xanthomonadales bacterium]
MFVAVCAAVQHAHQNLVVHSDLKPGNILVLPDGEVQLVDFGIARLLDQAEAGLTTLAEGGRPLTPQYASPEQIEGDSPTTLSDVYSLGVVLYRLLTGTLPYTVERANLRQLAEVLATTDPSPPSRHRPGLPEDLDNIVLKAMAREPERRYVSAAALAEDVQRWLAGEPVQARPATLAYQLGKFVRRHRWPVLTAGLALVALAALATVLALSNARIAAQARQLQAERDRAEATADFWAGLFEQADPVRAQSAATSTAELLDRARAQLTTEETLSRASRSRLLAVISTAYWNLANPESALAAAEQAVALQDPTDPPSETAAVVYKQLANIAMSLDRLEQGRQAAEQAMAQIEQLPDAPPALRAQVLDALALVLDEQGQPERAAELLEQVVAIQRQLPLEEIRVDMATALGSLGYMHYRLATQTKPVDESRLQRADTLVAESLRLLREAFGENHPQVGFMLNASGVLSRERGNYAAAAAHFAAAGQIAAQSLPDGHTMRVSLALNQAEMLLAQQDWSAAESAYAQALGAAEQTLPAGHPDRIDQQLGIARCALGAGDLDSARQALLRMQAALPLAEAELPLERLWAQLLNWRLVAEPTAATQAEIRKAVQAAGDPAQLALLQQLATEAADG